MIPVRGFGGRPLRGFWVLYLASVLAVYFRKFWSRLSGSGNTTIINRVAFGSCCLQDQPQPIWDKISAAGAQLFLFIGDNIYADTEDMALMSRKYQQLAAQPQFAAFRKKTPVLATWDDHDYGINDGGLEYPKKQESKKIMLDFFGEPADSPRRSRPGIYTSYSIGPRGKRLQVLLLDLRWFRTPLIYDKQAGGYVPNPDPNAVMLGDEQWDWLEEELKQEADLRIIASSTQFVSSEHPWEKWANFPFEKARMHALIDRLGLKNLVFVSGDMHYGELSAEQTPGGYKLYDLSSSGMNYFEPGAHFPNRNRVAVHDTSANFGFVEIDWEKRTASLEVRTDLGKTVIREEKQF